MRQNKTILIVDDSELNIKILSDILKEKSYRIALARSGKAALEFVKMKKPDLILLDILMPEIDGFEVCTRLKANPETRQIPIIFISGLDKSEHIVRGFKAGAVDYIVKPFQKEVVLARVNTHLKLNETRQKLKRKNRKLKDLLNEVEYLSFHDDMTGLYNRRYFENELDRLDASRRLPITLLVADMDNLKIVNDNYGHKMGDMYIKAAAEVLEKSSRNEDIVARIGGDEFAIILPETDFRTAEKIYQRIKFNQRKYNQQRELVECLNISLGFAVKTKSEQNLDQIFKKADKMMYNNKGKRIYSS
ncbi:diguanylate cyclase [Halanaerobium sp. ST460_2HS_T2]|uniref:diguanylate cyclase n=1 Tax=Halanaerobium sp. ST460_2HS_T2 TaxID=2183914 RepID=UPI000DF32754|nr:diguanylate cyclase [Halanaerobium sp. ST460_2HS_T2]RCW60290.1 response regulator receiver modulated diguanylate cyclase [Halanaerobium sp. ST460_2HS_T2]